MDRRGRVYIADFINRRIQLFDNSGQFVAAFGYPKTGTIRDIAVRADGVVFAIDSGHVIGLLDRDETELRWADRADLQRTQTFRIRVTDSGMVYLEEQGAEDVEHLVRKYHAADDFRYLATLAFRDLCLHPYLDLPYGIALDTSTPKGRQVSVAAYDFSAGTWETTPLEVDAVPSESLMERQLRLIGVDGQFGLHLLVTSDPGQGVVPRVLHYSREGALRSTTSLDVMLQTDVDIGDETQQVAVDPGGNLYIAVAKAEDGFEIRKISAR